MPSTSTGARARSNNGLKPPISAVPVWTRKGNLYDLLKLKPSSDAVDEYVIELKKTSRNGEIETRVEHITSDENSEICQRVSSKPKECAACG